MMNLLKIYALLRSPIFWVFIILVWIGISLPESWQEGWAEITVGIIGTMIAIAFCRLFNIAIGWGLLFCGAVAFALHPILGSIILAIAIILLVAMFSNSSTNNTTTPVKNIDKKFKTPKDLQDEEIEYRKKQKPRKVKNPFTEAVQIDEPIDVEPFIKIRDAINSINFNSITPSNLYFKLTEIEDKVDMRIFRTSETTIDTLKEMKDKLNAADLDNKTAISLQELFGATEEDAKDYEDKYMKKTANNDEINIEYKEDEDDDFEISKSDEIALGALGYMAASEFDKHQRIKRLKNEVNHLDNEYKFERGFDPDWDEDEYLSSKYKGVDEEKYLKARKEELKQKNLSYDNYLTPEERDDEI